jgi:hypothetical protein
VSSVTFVIPIPQSVNNLLTLSFKGNAPETNRKYIDTIGSDYEKGNAIESELHTVI